MDVLENTKNSHHPEFQSAIQETHRITAADPSASLDFTQSKCSCSNTSQQRQELSHSIRTNFLLWQGGEISMRQEIWQSWWSDDSKWNTWSSWSQDTWRETQSQININVLLKTEDRPPKMAILQFPTGGVNNTPSTKAHFQRLRTPAHAVTRPLLFLRGSRLNFGSSHQGSSLRLTKKSFVVTAMCIHRLHGHTHALHGHLAHRHHSRHRRHAGQCLRLHTLPQVLRISQHSRETRSGTFNKTTSHQSIWTQGLVNGESTYAQVGADIQLLKDAQAQVAARAIGTLRRST